jgi:hypothetical protein
MLAAVGGVMVDLPASPARSLFPPPSFPVYGVVSPFGGARYLELFGDPPDGEPHWVSLWHQSTDARSVITVTTYTRRSRGYSNGWRVPTDEQAAQHGKSALESVASQCTTTLVDLTLPVLSVTRPPGLLKALVGHAQTAAEAHADWATVGWRVDGIAVQAPAWSFAGGWAGFTDAAEAVYVSAVGLGPDARPEGLALAALRDSAAYHFDLHGPLSLELAAGSRQAAGVSYEEEPPWRSTVWHPDQLQFMG